MQSHMVEKLDGYQVCKVTHNFGCYKIIIVCLRENMAIG